MITFTRREALQMVGMGAAATALRLDAFAQAPTFPKGAVIRTLFKDYAPEDLAGGATLFHEHLSLGPDFGDRFRAASAAVLAAQGAPPTARPVGPPPAPPGPDPQRDVDLMAEELRSAQRDGVACIVDAGLEGAGVDLEIGIEAVGLTRQQRLELAAGDLRFQRLQRLFGLGDDALIALLLAEPDHVDIVGEIALDLADARQRILQRGPLLHQFLGFLRIVPEIGVFGELVQLSQPRRRFLDVKDASSAARLTA